MPSGTWAPADDGLGHMFAMQTDLPPLGEVHKCRVRPFSGAPTEKTPSAAIGCLAVAPKAVGERSKAVTSPRKGNDPHR